jgi:tRNA(Ile)-lysidine synthase
VLSQVQRTIHDEGIFVAGERVLVGLSGGPDSTALLHALLALAPRLSLSICAATVDHGLRPESAAEADMVAGRSRALGLPSEVVRVDVRAARGPHVSWQQAAREARLSALQEVAQRLNCTRIALGHNADDQAETVLFRIVRGTGVAGLAGIPYRRDPFVRPLLDVRRSQILAFLAKRKIPYVTDPSNANPRYTRVRVRQDWLPMLTRENPRVVEALLALARQARDCEPGAQSPVPGSFVPRRAADVVRRLARDGAGTRRVAVSHGDLVVSYGKIEFLPSGPEAAGPAQTIQITGPGVYRLSEVGAPIQIEEGQGCPPREGAVFDLSKLALPLALRTLHPGERMRPRGGRGSSKISDLLINAKVPRPQRTTLPVLAASDGTVLFVRGLRPSEVARPDAETHRWLRVSAP